MTCLKPAAEKLCTTCRLAGLIRCPSLGTPLPLVEGERPVVEYKATSEALRIWKWVNDGRRD